MDFFEGLKHHGPPNVVIPVYIQVLDIPPIPQRFCIICPHGRQSLGLWGSNFFLRSAFASYKYSRGLGIFGQPRLIIELIITEMFIFQVGCPDWS